MRKNKTIGFALAALLLVGGTFTGTKSMFTDYEKSPGEVTISTGSLNINVTNSVIKNDKGEVIEGPWYYKGTRTESNTGTGNKDGYKEDGDDIEFDNLKGGDIVYKNMTLTNDGTLNANISFIINKENIKLPKGVTYEAYLIDNDKTETKITNDTKIDELNPGDSRQIRLELKVTDKEAVFNRNEETANSAKNEANIVKLENSIQIKAIQTPVNYKIETPTE